jgi:hypothetical protein
MNRWVSSLCGILLGCAFCIPPGSLLLVIYGLCLTDPHRPDYHVAKLRMMFRMPDPGVLTWLAVGGVFLGWYMAVVGGIRPFLGRRPACLSSTRRKDMASVRETFGHAASRQHGDERLTQAQPEGVCKPDLKQAKANRSSV